jgi:uncharacterized RDD family membrane protein YckC
VNSPQPEFNPYAPPAATEATPEPSQDPSRPPPLANRGDRFAAAFVDGVAFCTVVWIARVIAALGWGWHPRPLGVAGIGWTAFELALWVAINSYLLAKSSQTLGKHLFSLQIVNFADGRPTSFAKIVFVRLPATLLLLVPTYGVVTYYVGIALIFGPQRRCLHDFIAGTKVVDLKAKPLAPL